MNGDKNGRNIVIKGIIYLTTNKVNGNTYIGQSTKSYDWNFYENGERIYYGSGRKIKGQLEKFGRKCFIRETLELVEGQENLNNRETVWVQFFKPTLNLMTKCTGRGACSEESRKKTSEANKGKKHSEETKRKISISMSGEKHPLYGKHHSEEAKKKMKEKRKLQIRGPCSEKTKQKISEAKKGKSFSKEHRQNLSKSLSGRIISDEWKQKMSESKKGNKNAIGKRSKEIKRKLSESHKGKFLSEDTKRKIGKSNKGKKRSNKAKQKISEGAKAAWKRRKNSE